MSRTVSRVIQGLKELAPKPPARPPSAYNLFVQSQNGLVDISAKWNATSALERSVYSFDLETGDFGRRAQKAAFGRSGAIQGGVNSLGLLCFERNEEAVQADWEAVSGV